MNVSLYLLGLVSTLGLATLTWIVSVLKRDVSIVDGAWAFMLLAAAAYTPPVRSPTRSGRCSS